jgi:hypothetical protein
MQQIFAVITCPSQRQTHRQKANLPANHTDKTLWRLELSQSDEDCTFII